MATESLPTTRRIDRAIAGGPITATGYNQLVDAIDDTRLGVRLPSQVKPPPRAAGGGAVEIMTLVSVHADHLVCRRSNDSEVNVARPFRLRRTPFDGLDFNGVHYDYADANTRTATIPDSNREQLERVIPPYVVDEEIETTPTAGVTITLADDSTEDAKFVALYGVQGWKRASSRI